MSVKWFVITLIGLFIAVAVVLVLLVGVEMYSAVVHPFPQNFDGSQQAICRHVEQYPTWVLLTVIPLWSIIAYIGTWLSIKLGTWFSGYGLGALLILGLALNLSMLPYPWWFKALQPIAVLAAIGLAIGTPRAAEHASSVL